MSKLTAALAWAAELVSARSFQSPRACLAIASATNHTSPEAGQDVVREIIVATVLGIDYAVRRMVRVAS